jgi:hypothetical protein
MVVTVLRSGSAVRSGTDTEGSASLFTTASVPAGLMAIASGPPPTAMLPVTVLSDRSMTDTDSAPSLATKA